jgi:hypothetical protein
LCSERPELLRRRYDENLALLGRLDLLLRGGDWRPPKESLLCESDGVMERRRSKSGREGIVGGSKVRWALIVGILIVVSPRGEDGSGFCRGWNATQASRNSVL